MPNLTPEFCHSAKQRLVFEPVNLEEAGFIAAQLKGMGFRYYSVESPDRLQAAVGGSIYLDNDKTIMISTSKPDGLSCTIDGFGQFFIPEAPLTAGARLSPEDCLRKTLAFYPRTNGEARSIVTALLKAGVTPEEEQQSVAKLTSYAVVHGLLVREGRMSFGPTPQSLMGAEICSAVDLGMRAAMDLSPEQATIMAAFNEMTARMEQMSQRIARLENAVIAEPLFKSPLPPPKR